jgi:hypothetical protein
MIFPVEDGHHYSPGCCSQADGQAEDKFLTQDISIEEAQKDWLAARAAVVPSVEIGLANLAAKYGPVSPRRLALYQLHERLTKEALDLMYKKNHDYASDADPYRNFRMFGLLGIVVRLGDKLARLQSFIDNGDLAVSDEQIEDTLKDIINYSVIFGGFLADAKQQA